MLRTVRPLAAALLAATLACDPTGSVTEPNGNGDNVVRGLALTAGVYLVTHDVTTVEQLTVRATLRNTTNAAVTVSYPLGCPVRIRLYKEPSTVPVYDESRFACGFEVLGSITVPANASADLGSGARMPFTVAGDSLPAGAYRATGVVQFVGDAPVEVEAGQYLLPSCTVVGIETVCTTPSAQPSVTR